MGLYDIVDLMGDKKFLKRAVELAKESSESVGCGVVIVIDGVVIAEEYNSQRTDKIAVNHAEIKAIISANLKMATRKLNGATAYCSCEPCAMCLTALSYAKVQRIIFYKQMSDVFPSDPQSKMDPYDFVSKLNFVPILEQIRAI